MSQESICITGLMIRRSGDYVIAEVEIDGKWVKVITEEADSSFSHIIEPQGIRRKAEINENIQG